MSALAFIDDETTKPDMRLRPTEFEKWGYGDLVGFVLWVHGVERPGDDASEAEQEDEVRK